MHYIIYIDVYFFVNFFMDLLLLCLLAWSEGKREIVQKERTFGKILLGALLGGILSCLFIVFVPQLSFLLRFLLVHGGIAYLMIKTAFAYKTWKKCMQAVGKLCLLEMLFGGMLNLFYMQRDSIFDQVYKMEKQEAFSFWTMAAASFFAVLLLGRVFDCYRKEKKLRSHLYAVQLRHKNKTYEGVGLLDTGNHLREPITGKAVVVVQLNVAQKLLGYKLAQKIIHLLECQEGEGGELTECHVRWIPYHSLGTRHGFMPGFCIDRMTIRFSEKEVSYENVWIGIMDESLSGEQLYEMILHEEYSEFG